MRKTARVQVVEPGLSTVQDLGRADGRGRARWPAAPSTSTAPAWPTRWSPATPTPPSSSWSALYFAATTDADLLVAVTGADADVTVDGGTRSRSGSRSSGWWCMVCRAPHSLRAAG